MGEDQGDGALTAERRTAEDLRREIEQTRSELGETAAALGAKADVKGRAKERVSQIKHRASDRAPDSVGEAVTRARAGAQGHHVALLAFASLVFGAALGRLSARR